MGMDSFLRKNIEYAALALVIILFLWKSYPLSNSYGPLNSSDYSAHVFKIWFILENGLQGWNSFWYGGSPLLKQYPPLSYLIGSSLSGGGVYLAYSLLMDLVIFLIPVSFLIFLRKFSLDRTQRSIALVVFSLSPAILVFYKNSNLPFITSLLFSIIFLVYFKSFLDKKTSFWKPLFLLVPVLLTHVLMATFLYISVFVWFASSLFLDMFSKPPFKKTQAVKFILILLIPLAISSFWYIPFSQGVYSGREGGLSVLSDPVTYTAFTTNQRLDTIGIPRDLFLALAFFLAISLAASIRKFKERQFKEYIPWFVISGLLFLFLDYKRIIILMIIPISLLVAYNSKKKHLYLLTIPLVLLTITVFSISSIHFAKIPEYPETGNRTIFYEEERTCPGCSLYSVFLPPMKGSEVINGWLPQSQNTNELFQKRQPYLQKIQSPLPLNYTEFNQLASAGMLNYIVVSSNSKAYLEYFTNNPALVKSSEENGFVVFSSVNPFSYLEINGEQIDPILSKNNPIKAIFTCKPGTLTIKETYDKGWSIKINSEPVKYRISQYGFIEADLDMQGPCNLEMVYRTSIL